MPSNVSASSNHVMAQYPLGKFQRFQLHRVVKAAKKNRLPGAFPGDAHGGDMTDKFAVKAQFIKGKHHLAVDRISQGVGGLTENNGVAKPRFPAEP